ncbi:MAG: hypothetical protein K8E24_013225, partial [Methanobacterium paludis]|nr:hypothetical protein [Methanobacterium paludis]
YQIHQLLSLINIECNTLFHMKVTTTTGHKIRKLLKDHPLLLINKKTNPQTYGLATKLKSPFIVRFYDYYSGWGTKTVSELWDDNRYIVIMRYG